MPEKHRWEPSWLEVCLKSGRVQFIAQCGPLDLWRDHQLKTFTLVNEKTGATDYEMVEGNLLVSEKDVDHGVHPNPCTMALIYEAVDRFNQSNTALDQQPQEN